MVLPVPREVTLSVLVTLRSAIELIVSAASVAELLPAAESLVPAGGVMVATFARLPLVATTVPVTVKVTLPPFGKVGMMMPVPCIKATVVLPTVGQAAEPVGNEQLTPVTVSMPGRAGSLKIAPFADEGPLFVTTMV